MSPRGEVSVPVFSSTASSATKMGTGRNGQVPHARHAVPVAGSRRNFAPSLTLNAVYARPLASRVGSQHDGQPGLSSYYVSVNVLRSAAGQ